MENENIISLVMEIIIGTIAIIGVLDVAFNPYRRTNSDEKKN